MLKLVLLLAVASAALAQTTVDPARVTHLLQRAVVIDLHDDTTQMVLDEGYNLAEKHNFGQVDIPRMRAGHVGGIFFSIWTDPDRYTPTEAIRRALDQIDAIRRETARHPGDLALAGTADEILAAHRRGRIAVLMGVEGGQAIDSDLAILRTYFALGARYMTLTHTENTPWADSSSKPPEHNGLTDFGKQVVREMNRLGMMVDISHVSDKTFFDALETSSAPIIASHSSCRALASAPRNMTDDMLRALAAKGGVVHINYFEGFLDSDFAARESELKDLEKQQDAIDDATPKFGDRSQNGPAVRKINAERLAKLGRIPLSKLLDHFEHAVKVAGIDHVGLGSDFDGVDDMLPEGMEDISKIPNLVRGLMERGFSDDDILKILGGNTLRVMRQVEAAAKAAQK
ncbi:MAG TPA: dipeptidase [Bryobacteraceae bacterium]|nr:dipeptidase [Bryobacteraceae bacterium]